MSPAEYAAAIKEGWRGVGAILVSILAYLVLRLTIDALRNRP